MKSFLIVLHTEGVHVHLAQGRTAGAAMYPPGLCRAICRGLAAQLREDKAGRVRARAMTVDILQDCHGKIVVVEHGMSTSVGT